METITNITNYRADGCEGFVVETTSQRIELHMDMSLSCCEDPGYFWCNDSTDEFLGARVMDVQLTNEALITSKAPEVYDGGVMFVNILTDRGCLQFVAYNAQNGYYGHTATVRCTQLTHEECL